MFVLIFLSSAGFLALLADIFRFRRLVLPLILTGLLAGAVASVIFWDNLELPAIFNNMVRFDHFANAFSLLILVGSALWFLFLKGFEAGEDLKTDILVLSLFSIIGAVLLVSFNNLTMFFLGVEILSIPVYVMAGSKKDDLASNESAFKYFLTGAFVSAFLLFGLALIYGATGSLDLRSISDAVFAGSDQLPSFFYAGVIMVVCALSFKASLVPFHFWTPDVYQGAPTVVTAFMSTLVKVAAFAAFFRLISYSLMYAGHIWVPILSLFAGITLIWANISDLVQTSVKRLLAYSSISHAGFMVMAIIFMNTNSQGSLLVYGVAYFAASLLAFSGFLLVAGKSGDEGFDRFNGLAKKSPLLALSMSIALLSLAGIPPLAGFFGKYFMLSGLLSGGTKWHILLAILGIVGSMISIYYYLKIIIRIYFRDENKEVSISGNGFIWTVVALCSLIIVVLGLVPGSLYSIPFIQ
jgi:NADH-quinone oxidoreductase subunit N